jgi:hypothetical protein
MELAVIATVRVCATNLLPLPEPLNLVRAQSENYFSFS